MAPNALFSFENVEWRLTFSASFGRNEIKNQMLSPTFSENGTFVQPVGKYLDMSSWNLETSSYIKWAGNSLILKWCWYDSHDSSWWDIEVCMWKIFWIGFLVAKMMSLLWKCGVPSCTTYSRLIFVRHQYRTNYVLYINRT